MPVIKNDVIQELNLEPQVETLILQGLRDPAIIAKRLNEDPFIKTRLEGKQVWPTHVRLYLEHRQEGTNQAHVKALQNAPEVKELSAALSSLVGSLLSKGEQAGAAADLVLQDFFTQRGKYMLYESSLDDLKAKLRDKVIKRDEYDNAIKTMPTAEYPHEFIKSIEKVARTVTGLITAMKDDERVQQIVKAGRLTVNQGMSSEQLIEELALLGNELGLSRGEVLSKYAAAKAKAKANREPIDA